MYIIMAMGVGRKEERNLSLDIVGGYLMIQTLILTKLMTLQMSNTESRL
jgi:hypothetical protein